MGKELIAQKIAPENSVNSVILNDKTTNSSPFSTTIFLMVCWIALVCAGFWITLEYEKTPAKTNYLASPTPSPGDISSRKLLVNSASAKPFRLIIFAHPKCPCTSATLTELDRFLSRNNNVSAMVYFTVPSHESDWTQTDNWHRARQIPQATCLSDLGGAEAKKFGAQASGEIFLFDQKNRLLFQGGITGARGHEGDNDGLDQLSAIVQELPVSAKLAKHVVYGCSLVGAINCEKETD